jgi:hypothetical protein
VSEKREHSTSTNCPTCEGSINSCGHSKQNVYSVRCTDGSGMSQGVCWSCKRASNSVTVPVAVPAPEAPTCRDCGQTEGSGIHTAGYYGEGGHKFRAVEAQGERCPKCASTERDWFNWNYKKAEGCIWAEHHPWHNTTPATMEVQAKLRKEEVMPAEWISEAADKIQVLIWNRLEEAGYPDLANVCQSIDFAQVIANRITKEVMPTESRSRSTTDTRPSGEVAGGPTCATTKSVILPPPPTCTLCDLGMVLGAEGFYCPVHGRALDGEEAGGPTESPWHEIAEKWHEANWFKSSSPVKLHERLIELVVQAARTVPFQACYLGTDEGLRKRMSELLALEQKGTK